MHAVNPDTWIEFDHLSTLPGFDTHDGSPITSLAHACNGTHGVRQGVVRHRSLAVPRRLDPDRHLRPRPHRAGAPAERVGSDRAGRAVRGIHAPAGRARRRVKARHRMKAPAIEVEFPDLARWAAGNTGIPYVWRFAAERPGPRVTIQALTHGNEVCGAIANDWLLRENVRPVRGHADAHVRQRRRVPPLRCRGPVRVALRGRGLQPVVVGRSPRRRPADARPRACPRAAPRLRRNRLPARPAFDDRPVPAAGARGPAAEGARARLRARPARAHRDRHRPRGWHPTARLRGVRRSRSIRATRCSSNADSTGNARRRKSRSRRRCGSCATSACSTPRSSTPISTRRRCPRSARSKSPTSSRSHTDDFRSRCRSRAWPSSRKRGSLLARDGATEVRTPYDDAVLIMPARRPRKGETAVRIGRFVS